MDPEVRAARENVDAVDGEEVDQIARVAGEIPDFTV